MSDFTFDELVTLSAALDEFQKVVYERYTYVDSWTARIIPLEKKIDDLKLLAVRDEALAKFQRS